MVSSCRTTTRRCRSGRPAHRPQTKAKDNPLFPSGSKRKRAAITGASYLLEAVVSLTREAGGRLRLTCAKDRHGNHRRKDVVAVLDFRVYPDGGTSVKVWTAPPKEQEPTPDARVRDAASAAVRAAREAGRPLSTTGARSTARRPQGVLTHQARGIDHAVTAGAIRTESGPRRARCTPTSGTSTQSSANECV